MLSLTNLNGNAKISSLIDYKLSSNYQKLIKWYNIYNIYNILNVIVGCIDCIWGWAFHWILASIRDNWVWI